MFMGFCGLVPSEHSPGERTQRGGITHAGTTHLRTELLESAETRLCGPFHRLDASKTNRTTVVTAIARELAGFVWAEMTAA